MRFRVAGFQRMIAEVAADRRILLAAFVFALLFGLSCSFAAYAQDRSLCRCFGLGFLVAIPIAIVFLVAVAVLKTMRPLGFRQDRLSDPLPKKSVWAVFLISLLVLLVPWLLVFLVVFPGCCSVDSSDVLKMALGVPFKDLHFRYDAINNHHPALYTFFVWVGMNVGSFVGFDEMACVGLVSFVQMVLFAACCALGNTKLFELSGSNAILAVSSFFFLFNPLLALYSITLWKDILFSGCFFVFVAQLAFLVYRPESFWEKKANGVLFAASGLFVMLLRSNAVIVTVLALVLLAVAMNRFRKRIAVLVAAIIVPAFLVLGPLYLLLGIAPAHFSETVGVPLQQLSRTVCKDGSLTDGQKDYLGRLLPMKEYKELYSEGTPNNIKFAKEFDDSFLESDKLAFLGVWLSVGAKNKSTYLEAWIAQTRPFWDVSYEKVYYKAQPGYTLEFAGQGRTVNYLAGIARSEDLDMLFVYQCSLAPHLLNIAALSWLVAFVFAVQFALGRKKGLLCLSPLMILWFTYLLAAPAGDYRYILPLFMCFPVLLYVFFAGEPMAEDVKSEGRSKPRL